MRIKVTDRSTGATESFLNRLLRRDQFSELDRFGRLGLEALRAATPVETGLAAHSWGYRVITGSKPGIEWYNTDTINGTPLVILLQYGHATGTGGYVEGRDFINPAIRSVFDQIADEVWKKVSS